MDYFAGLDISMDETHVCVLDREGEVVRESKTVSTAQAIADELAKAPSCSRIVFETGRMAPILFHGLRELGFPVVCVESRQAYQALKSLSTHKTDRNDARPSDGPPPHAGSVQGLPSIEGKKASASPSRCSGKARPTAAFRRSACSNRRGCVNFNAQRPLREFQQTLGHPQLKIEPSPRPSASRENEGIHETSASPSGAARLLSPDKA
jgi:Transposase